MISFQQLVTCLFQDNNAPCLRTNLSPSWGRVWSHPGSWWLGDSQRAGGYLGYHSDKPNLAWGSFWNKNLYKKFSKKQIQKRFRSYTFNDANMCDSVPNLEEPQQLEQKHPFCYVFALRSSRNLNWCKKCCCIRSEFVNKFYLQQLEKQKDSTQTLKRHSYHETCKRCLCWITTLNNNKVLS